MDGLILVDKPADWTSHDVVLHLRKILKTRRIGHCGSLDPKATGVLLVTVGQATRLFPFLSCLDKTYRGKLKLGQATDTYDSQGKPQGPQCHQLPEKSQILEMAGSFEGEISQLPPPYSAKKIDGQPAYKLARRGLKPELNPVKVAVYKFLILDYDPPDLEFLIECSSGTYIRSLAHDLGHKLGCGAHLTALRRVAIGCYTEEEALKPESLENLAHKEAFAEFIMPLEKLLPYYPAIWLNKEGYGAFLKGAKVSLGQVARAALAGYQRQAEVFYRVFSEEDQLIGLATFDLKEKAFQPGLVFNTRP
jgi:tRNA pseudouridine55 synthase